MKRLDFSETKRTPRYSLRKLNVGVASVLLGVTIFGINFTNHSVKAVTTESVEISNSSPNSNSQQTKGINAIGAVKVPSLTDSQSAAKDVVDTAVAKQKELINNSNNLSDSEKQDLNQQVDAATKTAKDAIDAATTNDGATKAGQDGVAAIEKVVPTSLEDAKRAANQLVDEAVSKKLDEIKANTNLTDEEKAKLTNDANTAANNAKANIQAAKTNDAVKTAKENGVEKINNVNVPATSATKDDAKNAIDQAAKTKDDAIDTSNLTAEEKADLKKKVAEEVQKAKDNIDAATKDADVNTAQTNGEKAIDAVEIPASVSKTDAINAINAALTDKKAKINGTNLTAEEKTAVINKAQKLADDAIADINKATTNDAVNTAKENGVEAINAVEIPTSSKTKNDANSDLDNTADAAKKAIDETSGLTDDQKQTAKDQIDTAVGNAQENIKKASDNQGVADAKDAGKLAIDKVSAKAAIDAALNNKKSAIAKAPLTAEEAKPLNDLVDQEADAAKAAIDDATTNAVVEAAKNNGVEKINNINVPTTSATKDAANKAIENALAKKIEEIKANTNLTDDQKQSLIDQAQNAANQAKENVRSASTDEDVQTAKNNGIAAINGITVKSNSVDDQDNSATNEGNGNQAGYIQSDNSSDVTKHSSTQQSGNEKTQLPQTGNEIQRGAGLVGLAIAGLVGLLGSAGFRKKRD